MISPLAHIHPDAKIGKNVKIDPFAVINKNVSIGDNTHIMSNAYIDENTTIGTDCLIFPGAVIGTVPQDLKYTGEVTSTEVGNHTTIREGVTIHRGTKEGGSAMISEHVPSDENDGWTRKERTWCSKPPAGAF